VTCVDLQGDDLGDELIEEDVDGVGEARVGGPHAHVAVAQQPAARRQR